MVNKLIKHDFMALLRLVFPVHIVVLGMAILLRITALFESDTSIYAITLGSMIFLYAVSIFVCFIYTKAAGIIRFYKNLFTREGYLTFTLPVPTSAHLASKLLVSVIYDIFAVITTAISLVVVTSGNLLVELLKAFNYLMKGAVAEAGLSNVLLIALEIVIILFLSTVGSYLMFFSCISIGQLAKKNRILLAVGVYFGYFFISQIFSTIISIAYTFLCFTPWFEKMLEYMVKYPMESWHIMSLVSIASSVLMAGIYYAISHFIIKHRLNLE